MNVPKAHKLEEADQTDSGTIEKAREREKCATEHHITRSIPFGRQLQAEKKETQRKPAAAEQQQNGVAARPHQHTTKNLPFESNVHKTLRVTQKERKMCCSHFFLTFFFVFSLCL